MESIRCNSSRSFQNKPQVGLFQVVSSISRDIIVNHTNNHRHTRTSVAQGVLTHTHIIACKCKHQ